MLRRRFMLLGIMAATGWRSVRALAAPVAGALGMRGQPPSTGQATYDTPNRTKVVRLIVVPDTQEFNNPDAVANLAATESASRADVFIVKQGNKWEPRSWNGTHLIDHDLAIKADREAVVFAMVLQREQIQWESSVPFEIVSIVQKASVKETGLVNKAPTVGSTPDEPFGGRWKAQKGAANRPIRSGPPHLNGETDLNNVGSPRGYDQLYKVTFRMTINGEQHVIDPDVYCDWGG